MPRPKSKDDLLKAAKENYDSLIKMIDGMTEEELSTPFDFSDSPSKKEAHWSRDKNVRDILIHLYEWHQLLLNFPKDNAKVKDKKSAIAFLPADYTWKNYGAMNLMFWQKHQETSLEDAKKMFAKSHKAVMSMIEKYTNEELFMPKYFPILSPAMQIPKVTAPIISASARAACQVYSALVKPTERASMDVAIP